MIFGHLKRRNSQLSRMLVSLLLSLSGVVFAGSAAAQLVTQVAAPVAASTSKPTLPTLSVKGHSEELLQGVMTKLAAVKSAQSSFVEKRYLKLLKEPIESTGTLSYTAPDRFEKQTQKPIAERMSVERHMVTIQTGQKKPQQIYIDQHPALAAIVDAIRGALSGNSIALKNTFNISAEGSARQWTLNLVPTEQKQAGYIRVIRVSGADDFIEAIEIQQADGDRSVMQMVRK
jgi:outer membrane lipoprotein-sorting protein